MFSTGLSALSSAGISMNVIGNNIANMNTDGFRASTAVYENKSHNNGVQVSHIQENAGPSPVYQDYGAYDENGRTVMGITNIDMSNTDVAREFTSMISTQRMFEANVQSIRARDDMYGTIFSMLI